MTPEELQAELQDIEKNLAIPNAEWPGMALYHYTTADPLLKILQSREIWATDSRYLNDRSEIVLGEDLIQAEIREYAESQGASLRQIMENFAGVYSRHRLSVKSAVFVAALSTRRNLLSQWRAYAGNGAGYSIGFRSIPLPRNDRPTRPEANKSLHLVECSYSEREFRSHVRSVIDQYVERLLRAARNCTLKQQEDVGEMVLNMLLRRLSLLAPSLKDEAFAEESEWRLVSLPWPGREAEAIHYRSSPQGIVPYVRIPLVEDPNDPKEKVALEEVIVGPTLDPHTSVEATKGYLEKLGLDVRVEQSGIPYR